eukprot:Nk52_evm4s147 gene=Nk52_evmTU4s147
MAQLLRGCLGSVDANLTGSVSVDDIRSTYNYGSGFGSRICASSEECIVIGNRNQIARYRITEDGEGKVNQAYPVYGKDHPFPTTVNVGVDQSITLDKGAGDVQAMDMSQDGLCAAVTDKGHVFAYSFGDTIAEKPVQLWAHSQENSGPYPGGFAMDVTMRDRDHKVCSSSFFSRVVHEYEAGEGRRDAVAEVRTYGTIGHPTSVQWIGEGKNLLGVTEHRYLTILDPRVGEKGGVIERVGNFGSGTLNCLAESDPSLGPPLVAVSGGDRVVYALDARKWKTINSWKSAIKYDVHHLVFSSVDRRICYAASGVDSELACGSWDLRLGRIDRLNSTNIVRADSRWQGLVKVPSQKDTLIGLTAQGSLYVCKNARMLFPKSEEELGKQPGAAGGGEKRTQIEQTAKGHPPKKAKVE